MIKSFIYQIKRSWSYVYYNDGFLKRFTTVLGVDILVKASGFILLPIFLKLMSQEEFGLYNYIISIVQTFSLVLNLGLYIPQSKLYHTFSTIKEKGALLFTIYITLIAILFLFFLPIIVFKIDYPLIKTLFENQLVYTKYRGFIFGALLMTVLSFMLTNFFYSSEKIKQVKAYNIYRIVIVNIVVLLSFFVFKENNSVSIRLYATYFTELAIFCLFVRYALNEIIPSFDKKLMLRSLKTGLPIMASAIFGIVVNFSDKFLLQKFGSLKDLSNYYLAMSFAGIIQLIFSSLQNVWLPELMKEKDVVKSFKKTKSIINKVVMVFTALSLFIWLFFIFLIQMHIIPNKYSNAVSILPIMLLTQIVMAITTLYNNYFVYFEKTFLASLSGVILSIVSIVTGLYFIPKWGVSGAAISTLIVNLFYLLAYYFLILSFRRKYTMQNVTY